MEQITTSDLILINNLSSRIYSKNTLLSNANEQEKEQLSIIKSKLKEIAKFFSKKYNDYGPFETSVVTGNDIAIGGINFKKIWSGIFKGADNKQYAAQISFVMSPSKTYLNVGFYFGKAQGHSKTKEEKAKLEKQLKDLGSSLQNTVNTNESFRQKYFNLFDIGFIAYSNGEKITGEKWITKIKESASNSEIIAKVYPNSLGIIESSKIDFFVSQIIFLMSGISNQNPNRKFQIPPLTPEQYAKKAERLAEIGSKGELYIMEIEREKLKSFGITHSEYPKHNALDSTTYGFDITSINKDMEEIYIEVKTTTRTQSDPGSRKFFLSSNEFSTYRNNKSKFKLYRVYDIEGDPSFEELEIEVLDKVIDGYTCRY